MKALATLSVLAVFILTGCAHKPEAKHQSLPGAASVAPTSETGASKISTAPRTGPPPAAPASAPDTSTTIVTPAAGLSGKVARYNDAGRFAVVQFPVGQMAAVQQRLFLYRDGLKVGELKVTGPQRDDYTVADLTTGEARVGDEVRDK